MGGKLFNKLWHNIILVLMTSGMDHLLFLELTFLS